MTSKMHHIARQQSFLKSSFILKIKYVEFEDRPKYFYQKPVECENLLFLPEDR